MAATADTRSSLVITKKETGRLTTPRDAPEILKFASRIKVHSTTSNRATCVPTGFVR